MFCVSSSATCIAAQSVREVCLFAEEDSERYKKQRMSQDKALKFGVKLHKSPHQRIVPSFCFFPD